MGKITKDEENEKHENVLKIFTQHLYDDVFSFIFAEQTNLFLPLINEAFGTEYDNNTPIKVEANNFMPNRKKRIADALVSIGDLLFHFECESKNGEILLRIEEYDELIANRFVDKTIFTAVVYIRNSKLKDSGMLEDGRKIPYIKVQDYSMKELFDKQLYILLPYYVMRYENKIKNNVDLEYKKIVTDLKVLYNKIENLKENELLKNNDFANVLCKMCVEITLRLSKDSTFAEYLKKEGAMPMTWMTYEQEILQAKREALTAKERGEKIGRAQGEKIGREQGEIIGKEIGKKQGAFDMAVENIRNAMDSLQLPFDKVCEILKINDKEQYRNHIR